ncbi:unnamed protein product [Arabis nemorensis]|uniref:Uncharacterized protein n=1 Tax=Arabis nemorensis TaxID=586526 RepID=A0A565CMU8_9BRAS|nr:unnamed protein product [Arabis nemorensis]
MFRSYTVNFNRYRFHMQWLGMTFHFGSRNQMCLIAPQVDWCKHIWFSRAGISPTWFHSMPKQALNGISYVAMGVLSNRVPFVVSWMRQEITCSSLVHTLTQFGTCSARKFLELELIMIGMLRFDLYSETDYPRLIMGFSVWHFKQLSIGIGGRGMGDVM